MNIEIRGSRLEDAASLSEAIIAVASEGRYLATVDGFSPSQTAAYIGKALQGVVQQVVAVTQGSIIGACDVRPHEATGFSHVGQLGMFVRREWRGQGIGRQLLVKCLSLSKEAEIEKIELEVFADNDAALHLYESIGFLREGLKVRGRKREGNYQDVVLMALWL